MGDVLIRDVPESVVDRLKERASRNGRSLQQELLRILTDSANDPIERYVEHVRDHRARYEAAGRTFTDSVGLIRERRER